MAGKPENKLHSILPIKEPFTQAFVVFGKKKKKKKDKKCCKSYKKKDGKMCKDCPKLEALSRFHAN